MTKPKDWLTVSELQQHVINAGRHWSRTYIQYLINSNRLPSFKISGSRLFLVKDADIFLSKLKRKAPPILTKKYS